MPGKHERIIMGEEPFNIPHNYESADFKYAIHQSLFSTQMLQHNQANSSQMILQYSPARVS